MNQTTNELRARHIKRLNDLIRPCESKGWLGEIDALRFAIAELSRHEQAQGGMADEVETTLAELDDLADDLDSWCRAYPTTIFPEPEPDALKWLHETKPGLCDRIGASMGRHMVTHMRVMETTVRRLVATLARPSADARQETQG